MDGQSDEECDGAEGCQEYDCLVPFDVQLREHVEGCLEVFLTCIQIKNYDM